jgi:hypothetical protein
MARSKSTRFRRAANALSATETPILLIAITHALSAAPLRVVNDVQDVLSNGNNFVACRFNLVWPDDQDKTTPRATLSIDNVHREVGAFFERTHGGRGAVVTVMQIMRSEPDFIEEQLMLDISGITVTTKSVGGQLGYDDVLNRAGTAYTYRPETAPGLF